MNSNRNQFAEEIFLVVCLCLYLTEDESEPFLLDIKGLVCDFSGAVINQSQLEAAERRRTHLIFDACDLHKLLVLENKAFFHQHAATVSFPFTTRLTQLTQFSTTQTALFSSSHPQLHFLPGLPVQVDGVQLRPADGLHVGLVALPEVDHLEDRSRVRAPSPTGTCVRENPICRI